MNQDILNNIYDLYKSHIITLVLFLLLGCAAVLTSIGVIKFELLESRIWKIAFLILIIVSVVLLLTAQTLSIIPIYEDYKQSAYVILENSTLTVVTDSTGIIDRTSKVVVEDNAGRRYELKMQSDLQLSTGCTYTGTVVYLINSNYVVWYSFD
jgi:hypothetical protein